MGPTSLPLWLDGPDWFGMNARSTDRARSAGLLTRPSRRPLQAFRLETGPPGPRTIGSRAHRYGGTTPPQHPRRRRPVIDPHTTPNLVQVRPVIVRLSGLTLISVSRFVSSVWSGASPVVCPCIAVMGLGPTACNRVGQTTGGAAHDERQGNRGSSMPSGARPGRQLEAAAQAAGWITSHLPPAAIAASHLWPVDTTA